MPDFDLEPHQYRRKATYCLRDMGWLVKPAVPLGILAPFLAAGAVAFSTGVVVWPWGLAPGVALIILHEALDGTRIRRADETQDQLSAEIGASQRQERLRM